MSGFRIANTNFDPTPKIKAVKSKDWAERIWEKRDSTVERICEGCGRTMHLPVSKAGRRFCTLACRVKAAEKHLAKNCECCGKPYEAWKRAQRFCSQKCNYKSSEHITSHENLSKAQEGRRKAVEEGRILFKSGSDNPQWKGGPKALRQRQIASGRSAAWRRRYCKENPDKVREFSARRKSKKLGRLPRGTLIRIRALQSDKCAICRVKLKGKGHLDHIMPIANGGAHAPSNLQFLCAPCNLTKSNKDPIDFMQSLGRLL